MKRLVAIALSVLMWVACSAYGETITHTFDNGDKYVGEVKNGKMHGQGTYTWPDGNKYVGEWQDSKRNGQGTYTWSNGDKYVGVWTFDKLKIGTYTKDNGSVEYFPKYKKIIKFVYQNSPNGTGNAILKCKSIIKSKYFLLLFPDDLIIKSNCSLSMIKLHKKYRASIIASIKVKKNNVSRWGIFDVKKINKSNFFIKDVIEKPKIKNAPSNYAVIGRYILSKKIFRNKIYK